MEDDQDHHRNPQPEMIWFCKECGKGFGSPQSRASHKRIHMRPVKEDKNLERTLQPGPAPAPVPARPSYRSTSLTLSLGNEHGDRYPTGRNDLSATGGLYANLREIVRENIPSVVTEFYRAKDMNRGDQEDDKMNQGANDLQLFDKMAQPNREDPESAAKRRDKRKLDDESKEREFFFEQSLGEHKASLNDNWWPSGYKARAPLDWGTEGEGSTNATAGGGLIIDDAEAEQHKCNRCWWCGSNFPTGQALGEHRCHHSTGSPAGNSSQGTGQGSRPVHDLDLNEPPAASVEDSQVNAQSDSIPD